MKTYASKASAVRQAKKDHGAEYATLGTIIENDGRWGFELTPKPVAAVNRNPNNPLRGTSAMSGACALVWDIAGSMLAEDPDAKRKDILQACVDRGIAFYTARTQYQKYREACKNDASNA